jgi:hypothetical protein
MLGVAISGMNWKSNKDEIRETDADRTGISVGKSEQWKNSITDPTI